MCSCRLFLAAILAGSTSLAAQSVPSSLLLERTEYASWLRTAPTSPYAAIALQRIGPGITLGPPGSDVVLDGLPLVRLSESAGRVVLDSAGSVRAIARNRVSALGRYRLMVAGTASRTTVSVFGAPREAAPAPSYFPYAPSAVDTVTLVPPAEARSVTLLSPEGTDVDAAEAGTVTVTRYGAPVTLKVRRLPGATDDEPEFEIYVRDGTSGQGSYPAGRFVSLTPLGQGRYVLDFNRARNPYCAYSSVFPCPAPWPGNTIPARVEAGETYAAAVKPK